MDKQKSILNITVSVTLKIVSMLVAIVGIRLLIRFCGNEVNGLHSLYQSILGFLAVAELGVGSAITFCMYKPIVDGDDDKVAALYHLFHRLYLIVGFAILALGLLITPFLRFFARDYAQVQQNLPVTFTLMLISVVLTYFFGAKTALINAHKNNYITTAIHSGGMILQCVLQILVLYLTESFVWYLVCRIVTVLIQWGITATIAGRQYPHLISNRQTISKETRGALIRNIRAMFLHKMGDLLVNASDSLVISTLIGVAVLGRYANYTLILSSMTGVIILFFTSLTSIFGHLYAEKSKETVRAYCEILQMINYAIGIVFFLGYYAIIDSLIAIAFSPDLLMRKSVTLVLTFSGFTQFSRRCTLSFRDATGTFYNDRWKPLVEGAINVALSVFLARRIGVAGVILATILTNLLICHIVEPYVLYRFAFSRSPRRYYLRNYLVMGVFGAALFVLDRVMQSMENQWQELLANGFISVGVSVAACAVLALIYQDACKFAVSKIREK